jgi:protease I
MAGRYVKRPDKEVVLMSDITGKRIAILATDGFEQSELMVPKKTLEGAGAKVDIISLKGGEIWGWQHGDWGDPIKVDRTLDEASVDDYDALVIPGGQINPDLLRADKDAVAFVRNFYATKKPLAAICHAPWVLVEAGLVKGRKMTSYHSMATDLKNAGAKWVDQEVVVDQGLITSRNPGDLPAFSAKIIEEVREGRHERRAVA